MMNTTMDATMDERDPPPAPAPGEAEARDGRASHDETVLDLENMLRDARRRYEAAVMTDDNVVPTTYDGREDEGDDEDEDEDDHRWGRPGSSRSTPRF